MKKQWRKAIVSFRSELEKRPVPIVSDAAVASRGIGEGRLIPLVIIDTSSRPDVDDLIRAHAHLPPGDVESQWARLQKRKDRLTLLLSFRRPSESLIVLEFDIVRQGIIIDQIVNSKALYIQPGRPGDRLKNTMGKPRILIEIPSPEFKDEWDQLFHESVAKELKRRGLSRRQAKLVSGDVIGNLRTLGKLRMPRL